MINCGLLIKWHKKNHRRTSRKKNQLITYDNVGHSFGPTKYNNMLMGGRFIENLRAGKDSDNKLFETLKRWMQ